MENNYAGVVDEIDDTGPRRQDPAQFARQRAAAYQAYFEHMPVRRTLRPGADGFRLFRRFDFGDLLRLNVLDTRQYRTDQPGGLPFDFGPRGWASATPPARSPAPVRRGGSPGPGPFRRALERDRAAGDGEPDPVPEPARPEPPFPPIANLDQWDGYDPARTRLLRFLRDARVPNPVVLAGDIHSSWFSDLRIVRDDLASAPVAVEFTATSISSDFPIAFDGPIKNANPQLNPHVRYFDGSRRGYLRMDIDRKRWLTDARTVDSIAVRQSPVRTTASWAVPAGKPGLVPA